MQTLPFEIQVSIIGKMYFAINKESGKLDIISHDFVSGFKTYH